MFHGIDEYSGILLSVFETIETKIQSGITMGYSYVLKNAFTLGSIILHICNQMKMQPND